MQKYLVPWNQCDDWIWINTNTRLAKYPDKYRIEQAWSRGIDSIVLSKDELELLKICLENIS